MFLELRNILKSIFSHFLNLIFDKKCIVCGCSKGDTLLCKTCSKDVEYLSGFPHRIFNNIPIYSATLYKSVVKDLIIKLKFKHKKTASVVLSKILFNYFKQIKDENKEYILCFVPSFFIRSSSRGFNHMFLIAKEFSKLTGIELNKNIIKKTRYTKPQYKTKDRHKNIKDSFKIDLTDTNLEGKTILLIDDIITSGATFEEIVNCFLSCNIKNIICLSLAKAGN